MSTFYVDWKKKIVANLTEDFRQDYKGVDGEEFLCTIFMEHLHRYNWDELRNLYEDDFRHHEEKEGKDFLTFEFVCEKLDEKGFVIDEISDNNFNYMRPTQNEEWHFTSEEIMDLYLEQNNEKSIS